MKIEVKNPRKARLITLIVGLIIGLTPLTFNGCDMPTQEEIHESNIKSRVSAIMREIRVVTYDSCEYLISGYDRSGILTHKGNCKNPIHYK